jgi:hypothetical protein
MRIIYVVMSKRVCNGALYKDRPFSDRVGRRSKLKEHAMRTFLILVSAFVAETCLGPVWADVSPCTDRLAQIEHFMRQPKVSPSAQQAVVAQLHHQPTLQSIESAGEEARAEVEALLARAKLLDAEGKVAECMNIVSKLTILSGHGAAAMDEPLQSSEEAVHGKLPLRKGLER